MLSSSQSKTLAETLILRAWLRECFDLQAFGCRHYSTHDAMRSAADACGVTTSRVLTVIRDSTAAEREEARC